VNEASSCRSLLFLESHQHALQSGLPDRLTLFGELLEFLFDFFQNVRFQFVELVPQFRDKSSFVIEEEIGNLINYKSCDKTNTKCDRAAYCEFRSSDTEASEDSA
jgi:hypothetical protein